MNKDKPLDHCPADNHRQHAGCEHSHDDVTGNILTLALLSLLSAPLVDDSVEVLVICHALVLGYCLALLLGMDEL